MFAAGDRVRATQKFVDQMPITVKRTGGVPVGVVVGHTRKGLPKVKWDQFKVAISIHPSFIEHYFEMISLTSKEG